MNNQVTQKSEDSKWRNNARPTDLAKKGKFREVNYILEIYFKLGLILGWAQIFFFVKQFALISRFEWLVIGDR